MISVLGIFVADISFSGPKIPSTGETILGTKYNIGPGGKGFGDGGKGLGDGGKGFGGGGKGLVGGKGLDGGKGLGHGGKGLGDKIAVTRKAPPPVPDLQAPPPVPLPKAGTPSKAPPPSELQ